MNDAQDRTAQEPVRAHYWKDIAEGRVQGTHFVTHAAFLAEQAAHDETRRALQRVLEMPDCPMCGSTLDGNGECRACEQQTRAEKAEAQLATERAKREEAEAGLRRAIVRLDNCRQGFLADELAAILAAPQKEGEAP
jgi:hypothetical protein